MPAQPGQAARWELPAANDGQGGGQEVQEVQGATHPVEERGTEAAENVRKANVLPIWVLYRPPVLPGASKEHLRD